MTYEILDRGTRLRETDGSAKRIQIVPHDPREYQRQRRERYTSRAGFYGLWLRQQGHSTEEAAALVAERYPLMRDRLRDALASGKKEVEERKEPND